MSEQQPLTNEELACKSEAERLVASLPCSKLLECRVGRDGAPSVVEFRWNTNTCRDHVAFQFYEIDSLRRYVAYLGRQVYQEVAGSVAHLREMLDERVAELRRYESLVAELERGP